MAKKLYNGMPRKDLVSSTAMVFGYAKNRKVEVARSIFDGMAEKDVVSWSAMISGYAESNQPNEALSLFSDMQEHGIMPDEVTVLSAISACANLGSLDKAIWIHSFTENNGLTKTLRVCNALIDMFAKCGGITLALNIFNEIPHKNVITWTSMIAAFAMHGDGKSALVLFEQMKKEGVEPNKVTFLNLLYACCHAGLVHEGRSMFRCMVQEYRIEPNSEHYGCMVDLLGRAKLLQEAVDLIESMHLGPNVAIWGSLLAACWMHGDLKLGAFAAKKVLELDPNHDGASVLLSKIYAKSGSWSDAEEVRWVMKLHGVSKETGSSWMVLNDPNHEFAAGGGKHPESDKILLKLDGKDYLQKAPMKNMAMRADPASGYPGRTYRFYTMGPTILPFGHGLSYTQFTHLPAHAPLQLTVQLTSGHAAAAATSLLNGTRSGSSSNSAHALRGPDRPGARRREERRRPRRRAHGARVPRRPAFRRRHGGVARVEMAIDVCEGLSVVDRDAVRDGVHSLMIGELTHLVTLGVEQLGVWNKQHWNVGGFRGSSE
ncbi:pentatricopeptide repeat-containing protein [Panicum miliaceum]|uniref:Pentatricopeptide repeat-containing protein n=1 Tax=Panicum miliaceum TaxID=4540 RepID=A0A3L6PJF0_PANMI|nr:pentatricopeptide repeat-containing protein [Panicum miliaceum]